MIKTEEEEMPCIMFDWMCGIKNDQMPKVGFKCFVLFFTFTEELLVSMWMIHYC